MYTGTPNSGPRRRKVTSILVTTSRPTATSTPNAGGALTLVCPRSGTVQCSTRIHGGDLHHHHHSSSISSSTNNINSNITMNYNTKGQVGVSHISIFPNTPLSSSSSSSQLFAMAYGASTEKSADSYGMLISMRRNHAAATVPPYVHWKCRLPESNMSGGLLISPVTLQHVIGGGHSGTLYVWNTLQNGSLIRVVPSVHYRAITCMTWSATNHCHTDSSAQTVNPWNAMLVTAGADGMVHCFSHVDLVDASHHHGKINPIRSWTQHNLPVTSLISIHQGSRIVSSGEDGLIVIMELCSGSTIATMQLPNAIRTLQVNNQNAEHNLRLFAGSSRGIIYIMDLDTYACHSTVQMGATIIQQPHLSHQYPTNCSIEDQVFGTDQITTDTTTSSAAVSSAGSNLSYQSELRGHDHAITSLEVFLAHDDGSSGTGSRNTGNECLISGDEMGIVRMWDTRRGCCLRVMNPWSSSSSGVPTSAATKSSNSHPVTSIHVIYDESNPISFDNENASTATVAMFGGTNNNNSINTDPKRKRMLNFANLIAPLQKFSNDTDDASTNKTIAVPFLQPRNRISSLDYGMDSTSGHDLIRRSLHEFFHHGKRPRRDVVVDERMTVTDNAMIQVESIDVPVIDQNVRHKIATVDLIISNGTTATTTNVDGEVDDHASLVSQIERLKEELEQAQQTIVRWETVNNKLVQRINEK